jgi:hypothetical protein
MHCVPYAQTGILSDHRQGHGENLVIEGCDPAKSPDFPCFLQSLIPRDTPSQENVEELLNQLGAGVQPEPAASYCVQEPAARLTVGMVRPPSVEEHVGVDQQPDGYARPRSMPASISRLEATQSPRSTGGRARNSRAASSALASPLGKARSMASLTRVATEDPRLLACCSSRCHRSSSTRICSRLVISAMSRH